MESPKTPEPILAGDLAVHLSYIRRDIEEIKNNQTKSTDEMRTKLDGITNSYVTSTEFGEHLKADADHETRIRVLENSMWKQVGMSSIIAAVASIIIGAIANHYLR